MSLDLLDRLRELPLRLRPRATPAQLTWPLTEAERERVVIDWPSRYDWPWAGIIVGTLRNALRRRVRVRKASTPQTWKHVVMLECRIGGRAASVAIDYNDLPDIDAAALERAELYFKLEHARGGYADPKIVPGGYTTTGIDYYRYYLPYRARYNHDRRIDVVGRFGYRFNGEQRRKAVAMLSAATDLHYVGNAGKVRYSAFLREAAAAKMCIDLPGNGSFTHRIAEFLGIGTCMVSVRHATVLHQPLEAGVHYVEVAPDLEDLVERCRYYAAHDAEREAIAAAARDYFDRYLHCDQLAGYYLRTILDRLS
jgi:hypothetical protein